MPADFARYRVEPGEHVELADHDPADTGGFGGADEAKRELAALTDRIAELQECLYAEDRRSLLVVLQGIDAAGKDSTVKHVFRETNPPADPRWYRNLVVARVVAGTLEQMDPRYPEPDADTEAQAREALESASTTS